MEPHTPRTLQARRFRGGGTTALALALTLGLGAACSVPETDSEGVETTEDQGAEVVGTAHGPVRGTVAEDHRTFQGIPYAAPPVGDLRWGEGQVRVQGAGERGPCGSRGLAPKCQRAGLCSRV